jgi:hypothetical protein
MITDPGSLGTLAGTDCEYDLFEDTLPRYNVATGTYGMYPKDGKAPGAARQVTLSSPSAPKAWKALEKRLDELLSSPQPYKTIVLDSLTTASELAMNEALMLDPSRGLAGGPAMQHYGAEMSLTSDFLKRLLTYPGHVYVIGHLDIAKDEQTGKLIATVLMTGKKTHAKIPIRFSDMFVFWADSNKDGVNYTIQTRPDSIYPAKTSLKGLDLREVPDFRVLIKKHEVALKIAN